MKYRIKMFLALLVADICILMTSGCELLPVTETTPTPEVTRTETEKWTGEPCLSPDAKLRLQFAEPQTGETVAEFIIKDYGSIFVRLFPEQAPKAVENFLTHAREGYYDNTVFHRVIEEFMVQGGDPEGTGYGGRSIWWEPFEDEFCEELQPFRGALCMANSGSDTNNSQFFLVQADATSVGELKQLVEYQKYSFAEYLKKGYKTSITEAQIEDFLQYGGAPWLVGHHTVFGQIYQGFEVLDEIAAAEVDQTDYRPIEDIILTTVRIVTY